MTSLARRHRERIAAEMLAGTALQTPATAPAIDPANPAAGEYNALLVSLENDMRQLSDIHSHDARKPKKFEMAETYRAWVQGALAAGSAEVGAAATQDAIVAEQLVWAIDYAAPDNDGYAYALQIARHMIIHGVALPGRFKASVPAFLAEKIAEAALKPDAEVPHEVIVTAFSLTEESDMHDERRANLLKALSRSFAKQAEAFDPAADNAPAGGKAAYTHTALLLAQKALSLHKKVGGVKDIEQLTRQLDALGGPPAPDPETEQKLEVVADAQGADASATG